MLTDVVRPSILFSTGLFVAAFTNFAFPYATSMPVSCALWALNGAFQGAGWPSLAKIVISTFPLKQRGSVWSILTTSGNIAKATAPFLLLQVYTRLGWKSVFWSSALLAGISCIWAFNVLIRNDKVDNDTDRDIKEGTDKKDAREKKVKGRGLRSVITSPRFWAIILGDVCIYFILQLLSDWTLQLLKVMHGLTPEWATAAVTAYETGGVFGTLSAGIVSDRLGGEGRRNLTSLIFNIVLCISLTLFAAVPSGTPPFVFITILFAVGFAVYGPKTMCGIAVREEHKAAAGSAGGFLGLAGQVAASMAGYPVGKLVSAFGWNGAIFGAIVASILGCFFFLYLAYDEKGSVYGVRKEGKQS